jgi:hypothetical protein
VLSFLIPWLVLLFIADNDTRFWWLWPLPCVVLAASVTHIPSRLQMSRLVTWVGSALLIFMLVANCFLLWGEAPNKAGWAGADPEEVQVVDYVHSLLQGRKRAAIGYHVFFPVFLPVFNAVDPRYKVGADFDLLFKDRHGVSNTNRCAEGVSPYDEFRILQTELPRYKSGNWVYFQSGRDPSVKYYFTILPDKSFSLLRQIGPFQVFRRGTEHIDRVPLREEQL